MHLLKKFYLKHKYFFYIFLFIILYEVVVVGKCSGWQVSSMGYSFHALDYSLGFASTILPGAIYHFLFGAIKEPQLSVYVTTLYVALFFLVALFLEKWILSVKEENRNVGWLLIFLFLAGPCTFSVFVTSLGMLEFYWVLFAALFFLFLAYRPLHFLIVPLCVLELLVNYSAILCFVPCFCILILFKLSNERRRSGRVLLLITFVFSVSISIPLSFYLALCVPNNMVYSLNEFKQMMSDRGVTFTHSIISFLYRTTDTLQNEYLLSLPSASALQDAGGWSYFQTLLKGMFSIVRYNFSTRTPLRNLPAYMLVIPLLVPIYSLLVSIIKNRNNSWIKRFSCFCMGALFPFTLIVSIFLSFDYIKWLSFAFLPLFASFLYVLYQEKEIAWSYIRQLYQRISPSLLLLYCSVYAVTVYYAYY